MGKGSPKRPTVQTFQSLVGSLLWISRCTRLAIAFAVHRVTRRSHAPSEGDWRLAKKIAKYLKGKKKLNIMMKGDKNLMKKDGVVVEAFSDAAYAADKSDRKSVSGGVFMVGGMIVGWMCKKQKYVALSTMEAEYVAASQTSAEMIGIVELLKEIGVQMQSCTTLHVDNQAAIAQIKGEDTSGRAKHIDVR
uniref:Polyprotein n=1 Tax=Peronospora matthiolae TaxID=2874970 RepID=A0AAV1TE48_9STRA